MALERKKVLSALTIHFATREIRDNDEAVIFSPGEMKNAQVEYSVFIEEDGVIVEGTQSRETAAVADLEAMPELENKVMQTAILAAARMNAAEAKVKVEEQRASAADAKAQREKARADMAELRAEAATTKYE